MSNLQAQHQPEDFAQFLDSPEPLFLVGGQAVNLWALYYSEHTAELGPFVSHDVDILGNRLTLERIAKVAGAVPHFFPKRPPTNEVGVVMAKGIDGTPLIIEVLWHLHGISNEELQRVAYTVNIGSLGVAVRIPSPIALLQAKIANAAELPQAGRQDLRHVRILSSLMPAYLEDIHATAKSGKITQRQAVNNLEWLLATVASAKGRQVMQVLNIPLLSLFPQNREYAVSKWSAFMKIRLPQALGGE